MLKTTRIFSKIPSQILRVSSLQKSTDIDPHNAALLQGPRITVDIKITKKYQKLEDELKDSLLLPKSLEPVTRPQGSLYPDTWEHLDLRRVRISRPSKNVMQYSTANTQKWKIEYDSKERWEYDLMGWCSTKDPLSNMSLEFSTKEAAIDYCDRENLNWFVDEQPERVNRKKSYADNFKFKGKREVVKSAS